MAEERDERRELYERFLAENVRDGSTMFFDEDDLIEVFDYASDMHDDYAKMEVLLLASRLYPGSVPLLERKAWHHYDLGHTDAARAMAESLPASSVMRNLLLLYIDRPEQADAIRELDRIVDSVTDFEDEWLIDLVEVAVELDCYEWLIASKKRITSKTSYPQTFIYELVNEAEQRGDTANAIALAEELTMLEPFNPDFWELLARLNGALEKDYEKALTSIDYALAVNPDAPRALMLKADALLELNHPLHEALALIEQARHNEPDNPSIVRGKAVALWSRGYTMEALEALERFRLLFPDDRSILLLMLEISDGLVRRDILGPLFVRTNEDEMTALNEWVKEARAFSAEGRFGAAATYLSAMGDNTGMRPMDLIMEMLYRGHRYAEAIALFKSEYGEERTPNWEYEPSVPYVYVLSRLRVNDMKGLREEIDRILSEATVSDINTYSLMLANQSLRTNLRAIKRVLDNGLPIDFDEIDLFTDKD